MTLCQVITGKHECWKVTAMYCYCWIVLLLLPLLLLFGTRAYLLLPDKVSCYIFSAENNCCEFLASYGIIFKVVFYHTSKRQFVAILFRIYVCVCRHFVFCKIKLYWRIKTHLQKKIIFNTYMGFWRKTTNILIDLT